MVVAEVVWRLAFARHRPAPKRLSAEARTGSAPSPGADARRAAGETAGRLPGVLKNTALPSGIILLLVGAAVTFGWMVTVSGLAREAATLIRGLSDNPYVPLLLVNILLFIVGMFLGAGPAILILGPVLGPIMTQIGVDPLHFATTTRPVKSPEGIKRLKIRSIPAEIQQEPVNRLGGNAAAVAWQEVYTSFATGGVEGTKNGIPDIMNIKFPGAGLKYLTLDGHAYMGALWWYSEPAWQQLPDDMKRIVFDGMNHLRTVTRAFPMRRSIEAYEEFRKEGGTIYVPAPEEMKKFQEASSGMRKWYTVKFDVAVKDCEAKVGAEFAAADQ